MIRLLVHSCVDFFTELLEKAFLGNVSAINKKNAGRQKNLNWMFPAITLFRVKSSSVNRVSRFVSLLLIIQQCFISHFK